MRINYYVFEDFVDAHTRYLNGCVGIKWEGNLENRRCIEAEFTVKGISIKEAKRLLKLYGGKACTYHCDRDGTVFEVTPIEIKGNNSKFKYNRHL